MLSSFLRAGNTIGASPHRRRAALFHSSNVLSVLHHEWVIAGDKNTNKEGISETDTIVFLHGLLGNGKNLKTLAKKVIATQNGNERIKLQRTDCSWIYEGTAARFMVILKGNIHSIHASRDVHSTLSNNNIQTPSVVMGHSWGGRIALQYLHSLLKDRSDDEKLPSLWLLDTVPGQAHDSVFTVLDAVQQIDFVNKTRSDVAQELVDHGLDTAIAQWLASTLQQDKTTKMLKWGFDTQVVAQILPEFQKQDFIGMLQDILTQGGNVHLVQGGRNTAWEESPRILAQLNELQQNHPRLFEQHTLPKAGHWVHVDDLPGLINIVKQRA